MKTLLEIIDLENEPQSNLNMRIEINLAKETSDALQKKAKSLNHSRKSYIEFLCIKDTMQKNKRKDNKKANT